MRHEVGQSNVPPTCENLFMHEKAGKASERESERDEGMGGNVAKRHSEEHKNKERPQERASKRVNAREREKDEHSVFVCDFLLIFSTLYSKAKVKWNGCPAKGRNGMEWDGMG